MPTRRTGRPPEAGALDRGLLWLGVGLLGLVLAVVLVAPELLAAPGRSVQLLAIVAVAGIPGLVLMGLAARRRRGGGATGGSDASGAREEES